VTIAGLIADNCVASVPFPLFKASWYGTLVPLNSKLELSNERVNLSSDAQQQSVRKESKQAQSRLRMRCLNFGVLCILLVASSAAGSTPEILSENSTLLITVDTAQDVVLRRRNDGDNPLFAMMKHLSKIIECGKTNTFWKASDQKCVIPDPGPPGKRSRTWHELCQLSLSMASMAVVSSRISPCITYVSVVWVYRGARY
jgi:hypothetical protein